MTQQITTISMKKLAATLFFAFAGISAFAQQDAQFSQYMFNQFYLNPAVAGADPRFAHFNLMYRRQWVGYSPTFDDGGAPNTAVFSYTMPLNTLNSGVGLFVENDVIGPGSINQFKLAYAYHINTKKGRLSLGVSGGFYNSIIDFGRLRFNDAGDPLLEGRGRESQWVPDFGLGVYYATPKFFLGVSNAHLLQPVLNYGTEIATNRLEGNYTLLGGVNFDLSPSLTLSPSAIVKTNLRNVASVEGSAILRYQDSYYFGLSLRDVGPSNDAIAMIGANVLKDKSLAIGYAFDLRLNNQAALAATSHEIRLGYRLPAAQKPKRFIIRTPRFRFE
jgi:type IX secretion system PorP/SprF family membrane protein